MMMMMILIVDDDDDDGINVFFMNGDQSLSSSLLCLYIYQPISVTMMMMMTRMVIFVGEHDMT